MDRDLATLLGVFAFATGACIASFLNVVIWRVPRGESISSPPSHCPKCGAPVRWYQNVPILSWLALRGKCANCREPISPRYILVETLGGCLFLAAFLRYADVSVPLVPCVLHLVAMWIWISLMIVGSFIDFDLKLLPDFVTVGGMLLGLVDASATTACLFVWGDGATMWERFFPLVWSVAGLVTGFGMLWMVRFLGTKAFGREAMGLGDVFLMGAVGALFGPVAVLVALILSSVFGSVAGLSAMALSKTKFARFVEIPYGPYICLGCLVWMFRGPELVQAYLKMLLP